jgi:hypothetical protein
MNYQVAKANAETAAKDLQDARSAHSTSQSKLLEKERLTAQAKSKYYEAARHRLSWERRKNQAEGDDQELDPDRLIELRAEVEGVISQADAAERALSSIRDRRNRIAQVTATRDALRPKIRTCIEALAILGKNGAQKRIVRAAIGPVEHATNERLRESSIPLSLHLQWERPTQQLATNCQVCGSPYPASRKAKTCELCGAERGPKLEEKLRLVASQFSGAAKDLGALAFQMTAGAWRRERAGGTLAIACLDEVFGQLDEHNRQALAQHVGNLLRARDGTEQVFVVAHDASTIATLPGRIRVTRSSSGDSKVSVEV